MTLIFFFFFYLFLVFNKYVLDILLFFKNFKVYCIRENFTRNNTLTQNQKDIFYCKTGLNIGFKDF